MDSFEDRFWAKVSPEPNTGCWLWDASQSNGYGVIKVSGKYRPAHRISYEMEHGEVEPGLVMDHLCRVPLCVNPAHLEPVTIGENVRRGDNFNRSKTHCHRGHEFTSENTLMINKGRSRSCRVCAKSRAERWQNAQKS